MPENPEIFKPMTNLKADIAQSTDYQRGQAHMRGRIADVLREEHPDIARLIEKLPLHGDDLERRVSAALDDALRVTKTLREKGLEAELIPQGFMDFRMDQAGSVKKDETMEGPPQHVIDFAIEQSVLSPCRSKRGSVIFDCDGNFIAHGYNYKPQGFECDGGAACKATCRIEAIHAEQRALLDAGPKARGCDMLHVKTVGGQLVPSGGPSCVQCSKLGLVAGVKGIWLYHESGWRFYAAEEWHRLSLLAGSLSAPPQAFTRDRDATCDWDCALPFPHDGPCSRSPSAPPQDAPQKG